MSALFFNNRSDQLAFYTRRFVGFICQVLEDEKELDLARLIRKHLDSSSDDLIATLVLGNLTPEVKDKLDEGDIQGSFDIILENFIDLLPPGVNPEKFIPFITENEGRLNHFFRYWKVIRDITDGL